MPLTIDRAVGALLHAMQPYPFTRRYAAIGFCVTLSSADHSLRRRQASRLASGKVTVYPSLANASPLIILALIGARRLILRMGANSHGHQHH